MKNNLYNFSLKLQTLLERVKKERSKAMAQKLAQMMKEAQRALSDKGVNKLSEIGQREFEKMLRDMRQAHLDILAEGIDDFFGSMQQLSLWQQKTEQTFLQKVADQVNKHRVQADPEVFKQVLKRPLHATGELLQPFMDKWSARQVDAVNNILRKGRAQGKTTADMVRQLMGSKARRWKDGQMEVSRREAEAVIRTATQHVSTATRMELFNNNSDIVQGYIFIATLDGVTSLVCRSLDHKKFKIDEGPVPPVHINCRSTTIPDLISAFDFLDKGAKRSSEQGYVAADLTYYEWLKTQSKEFQEAALGKSRAKMFQEGGLSAEEFASSQLDNNFKPLSVKELKQGTFDNLF